MTYGAYEGSVESGRPVEVFEITAGATTYYYTSAEDEVFIGAQPYTPIEGLSRTDNEDGPERRDRDFSIELPTSNQLAQIFTGVLPGFRVRIKAKRFHRDDLPTPEVIQFFDGFVETARFPERGKVTRLIARTSVGGRGRQMPRRTFASQCAHVLYDPVTCRVDDTSPAYQQSGVSVISQVGTTLTLSGLTFPTGACDSGFVEVVGGADYRLILEQTGNVLELSVPFSVQPSTVNVYVGCGHTIAACKADFDNVLNYGGFAFVPNRNPFESGV